MKKILAFLLAALMIVPALCACGKKDAGYKMLDEKVSTEQYAIGFLKGNTELRDAVNAELLKMAEDGTMLSIAEKYVDQGLVIDSLCLVK